MGESDIEISWIARAPAAFHLSETTFPAAVVSALGGSRPGVSLRLVDRADGDIQRFRPALPVTARADGAQQDLSLISVVPGASDAQGGPAPAAVPAVGRAIAGGPGQPTHVDRTGCRHRGGCHRARGRREIIADRIARSRSGTT